jgi:hypothetical protein
MTAIAMEDTAMDEETLKATNKGLVIPIAFAAAILAAIWYVSQQHAKIEQLSDDVSRLRAQVEIRSQTEQAIDRRLARVEVLLETMVARLQRDDEKKEAAK